MTAMIKRIRRRGTAYVFILGTAMLVTIIGMSALAVARVKLRATGRASEAAAARLYAQSGVEAALRAVYIDATWRDSTPHDTWQTPQAIGDGTFTWKIVDESSSSFTADRNAVVRAYGQGTCGSSVWIYSVQVQPPLEAFTSNALVNGDFESGDVSPWVSDGVCTLTFDSGEQHGGTGCLWAQFRDAGSAARQQVTGLTSGAECQCSVWVKKQVGGADPFFAGLWVRGDAGWDYFEFGQVVTGTTWAEISGSVTPTWSGTLQGAAFVVGNVNAGAFFMDDARLFTAAQASVGPIPGSWRREAQERAICECNPKMYQVHLRVSR